MKMTTYELKKHLEKKQAIYKLEEMLMKLEIELEKSANGND